jgi:PhnB protein
MMQIHPYLHFNGRCREAMTFYRESLDAELDLAPEDAPGPVLHAALSKDTLLLMGSDMQGPNDFIQGNAVSLSLNCASESDIRVFFKRLSADGRVICDVTLQRWGALFGVVTDKFGITWMLNYDRATQP